MLLLRIPQTRLGLVRRQANFFHFQTELRRLHYGSVRTAELCRRDIQRILDKKLELPTDFIPGPGVQILARCRGLRVVEGGHRARL